MTFYDLKQKEVINCKDCKKIGCVVDIDFDLLNGNICGLIVPAPIHFFSCIGKCIRYYIPYNQIVRIGPDIILVDVCLEASIMKND